MTEREREREREREKERKERQIDRQIYEIYASEHECICLYGVLV